MRGMLTLIMVNVETTSYELIEATSLGVTMTLVRDFTNPGFK